MKRKKTKMKKRKKKVKRGDVIVCSHPGPMFGKLGIVVGQCFGYYKDDLWNVYFGEEPEDAVGLVGVNGRSLHARYLRIVDHLADEDLRAFVPTRMDGSMIELEATDDIYRVRKVNITTPSGKEIRVTLYSADDTFTVEEKKPRFIRE